MPQKNKSLVKSFSWVAFSNIITKPFNVLLFIYAARILGTTQYGIYVYALSVVTIISIVFDFGLDYIAIREISQNPPKLNEYFSEILFIRIIFFIISLMIVIGYSFFQHDIGSTQTIAILTLLFFQFSTIILKYLKSISSAFEDFDLYSKLMIFEKTAVVTLGFLALFIVSDVNIFILATLLANIISLIIISIILIRKYKIGFYFPQFNRIIIILKEALPLLTMNIFILAYFRIDVVLLDLFTGDKAIVGLYGSIHRIIEMYILVPSILMTTAYPLVSKYLENDREFVDKFIYNILQILIIVSLPLAIIVSLNSYQINYIMYGKEYKEGSQGLIYLIWTVIPLGFDYVLGNLLISIKKQNYCALGVGVGAAVNILLNIILIPKLSFIGASISTLVTETVIFIIYAYYTLRYFPKIGLLQFIFKSAYICIIIILGSYLYNLVLGYNFILNCIFSFAFLTILLFLSGILNTRDFTKLFKSISWKT